MGTSETAPNSIIPRNSGATIRERWLALIAQSRAKRAVAHAELETGVHALFTPANFSARDEPSEFAASLRRALERIPRMTRGVRFSLAKAGSYGIPLVDDFRGWMGQDGADVAAGRADAIVQVDLAYLEAALLDRLHETEVQLEFNVPITRFYRGDLIDCSNVLEAAARMAFEGRSLMEAATRVAEQALQHFGTYAEVFWQLCRLYPHARWRIQASTFVMELPLRGISLSLRYWELNRGTSATIETWRYWIESLLEGAEPSAGSVQLGEHAA